MNKESNPHSSSESHFKEKLARAMTGDPVAQHLVGDAYTNGNGVPKDLRKAFGWYEAAAMQGHPKSEFNVGLAYEHGDGVEVNYKLALKWYTLAAQKGSVQAQNNLAHMYMDAKGTESDYNLALKLLKAAADKEHPTALNSLGFVYSKGVGVPKNDALSFEYYKSAADKGHYLAYFNVGSFYFHGDRGKQQDFHSAKIWYEKAAGQGVLRAFYFLGWMYGEAKLGKPNAILAYALTNVAASENGERNFEIAQYREQLRKRMTQDQINEAQILSNSLATPDTFNAAYKKYASGSRD
jgi:TPR repeat protein